MTVGDPGNTADTIGAGYGAVATDFRIMKYEFTNQQYTDFLNSVDQGGTNPNSLYHPDMESDARGGISFAVGAAFGNKYAVKTDMGNKPVNYVSFFDAARVSNWYQNGATSSSDTETGAYTLNGATSGDAPAVNPGATFYVPREDQWYKSAYYKGGSTNAGYWSYAKQSNTAPTPVTADSNGNGSAGNTGLRRILAVPPSQAGLTRTSQRDESTSGGEFTGITHITLLGGGAVRGWGLLCCRLASTFREACPCAVSGSPRSLFLRGSSLV